jgi:HPt (histidine-containing phosphotransfer) domain-containing protein
MIDKEQFRLVFADFDAEIIKQIVNIYTNEHPMKFESLETSFKNRDFNNLRNVAHGLKGVLSQFFASEAQQQAKELEFFARELNDYYTSNPDAEFTDDHKNRLKDLIESLKNSSLTVIDELKEIQNEYQ